jgi:hypothetical protein
MFSVYDASLNVEMKYFALLLNFISGSFPEDYYFWNSRLGHNFRTVEDLIAPGQK